MSNVSVVFCKKMHKGGGVFGKVPCTHEKRRKNAMIKKKVGKSVYKSLKMCYNILNTMLVYAIVYKKTPY